MEDILGEAVVEARTQSGGLSPGSADRVRLASGRRAFVKAVSADVNAESAALHRREGAIGPVLPAGLPAPEFLGMYDDGTWVALVLADVAGRHPQEPWVDTELATVLDALAAVAEQPLPDTIGLPPYEESLRRAFLGWDKLAARAMDSPDPGGGGGASGVSPGPWALDPWALDPWAQGHLAELAALARRGVGALAGNFLVHGDLRADNILLTEGGAVLLDWPWAARGSSWAGALSVLINVKTLAPESDVEHWFTDHPVFAAAGREAVDGVLAGWAGFFLDASRRPDPPGIPELRSFQRHQGDAVTRWLKERLRAEPPS